MGNEPTWGIDLVDEEDTGEVPRELLQSVLARIRAEERLRQRALRAMRAEAAAARPFEVDSSLDGPPPLAVDRRLWSPPSFFAGLAVFAMVPLAIIWWMLAA